MNQRIMRQSNLKGFTLVEVMIALIILGIGISLIYTIFPIGIRISREVQTLGKISFFAQKKLEELKTSNETLSDSLGEESGFNWTVKVEDFNTEDNIALKKVQLDAKWQQGQRVREKKFVTYFKY